MSNFVCEKCGTVCYDSPNGYVTGCTHYPADIAKSKEKPHLPDCDNEGVRPCSCPKWRKKNWPASC